MKISVIIPTYEKWNVLSFVLQRFDAVSFDKNEFEIIVCANGSKIPEGYFEQLNLQYSLSVLTEKEPNRALARNRSIVWAKGEIYLKRSG